MIHLHDVLAGTGGRVHGEASARQFDDFCYDSRLIEPGQLFLAVVTEKGDGHDYILDACRGGATGVLCQRVVEGIGPGITVVLVGDTQQALVDWAHFVLRQRDLEVVGITGSAGKTTTKEAVAAVLSTAFPTFKNHANYSGRYGLPIALGRLSAEHERAVLELASDHFDEIRQLCDLTMPSVGIVTCVNDAHLEFFGSRENIAEEKGYLVESLPDDGCAILNRDDPRVWAMRSRSSARVISYGISSQADIVASDVRTGARGTSFVVRWDGSSHRVLSPLVGRHNVYPLLAAIATGIVYGIPVEDAISSLSELVPLPGRLHPLKGIRDTLLLDDTHSASAASTVAALETLSGIECHRRIAVLGDITGMGNYEGEGHRLVGRRAAETADILVTKGDRARMIAEEAVRAGMEPGTVMVTYTAEDAVRALSSELQSGDAVLIKGSAEARMEQVTDAILGSGEDGEAVLVRQSAAWRQLRIVRPGRPTWVEVDLEAIAHNVRRVVELVGPAVQVMAVLKADAYGHGAVKTARTALNNGATALGVACLGEATLLRDSGIAAPILNLGFTPAWQARDTVLVGATATVFSIEIAQALSRAAVDLNAEARVHVKVDTGMGRLGLLPPDVIDFVKGIGELPGLVVEGIFTHFAIADSADKTYTLRQLERFDRVLRGLREEGIEIPAVHAANSAAIFDMPRSRFNMVRLGIAMYGLNPSAEVTCPRGFRPALAFKTQIAQVKALPEGSYVSYGCTFCTSRPSRIAVIPVGYADGFRRAPSNWGHVLVRGQRAPIVGRVCMDQTMIDVTDVPGARQGDEVVLIGRQGQDEITVDDVAERLGTINYEVVSEILARVPRVS